MGHLTVIATVHLFRHLNLLKERTETQHLRSADQLALTFDNSTVYEEEKCLTQDSPQTLALLCFERPVMV